jgi:hypothetical protein
VEANDHLGAMCAFEGESAPFADLGINLRVLQPDPRSSRWFQISATLPFSKRKMLTPEKVALRPVGSIAPHAPR